MCKLIFEDEGALYWVPPCVSDLCPSDVFRASSTNRDRDVRMDPKRTRVTWDKMGVDQHPRTYYPELKDTDYYFCQISVCVSVYITVSISVSVSISMLQRRSRS